MKASARLYFPLVRKNQLKGFSIITDLDLVERAESIYSKLPEEFALMASPQPSFFLVLAAGIIKGARLHLIAQNTREVPSPNTWIVPSENLKMVEEYGKKAIDQDELVIRSSPKSKLPSILEILSESESELVFLTSRHSRKVSFKVKELFSLAGKISKVIPPFNINLFPLDHVLSIMTSFFVPLKNEGLSVITPNSLPPEERIAISYLKTSIPSVIIPPLSYHRAVRVMSRALRSSSPEEKFPGEKIKFIVKGKIKAWDSKIQHLYFRKNDTNLYGFTEIGGIAGWRSYKEPNNMFNTVEGFSVRESSDLNGELEFSAEDINGGKFTRSRDIGKVFQEGKKFRVLGRKEEVVIRHEREISLPEIEDHFLKKSHFIKDIHIVLTSKELKALVVADTEAVARKLGVEFPSNEELEKFLLWEMKKLNSKLPVYAQLDSFYAVPGIPYSHREKVSNNSSIF